ncbi:MAG: tetratricopeptide repeat protein, partial [Acidiferrobacterales bacterium]
MVYALRIYSEEDTDRGLTLLAEAAMADPEDTRISLTLAKLLLREQRHRQACELLSALPKEKRELADVRD